jgi:hypothetical protein
MRIYTSHLTRLGRFPFNGLTGQTQIVFLCINAKNLVYVSQISSENGPHSNVIQIFRSDGKRP